MFHNINLKICIIENQEPLQKNKRYKFNKFMNLEFNPH